MKGLCRMLVSAWSPILLSFFVLVIACPSFSQARETGNESESSCFERLEMPTYPPLARRARITQVVSLTIILGDGGTVSRVEGPASNVFSKLFKNASEEAVRKSQFRAACTGLAATVVFHFELKDEESSYAFGYPNHFYVRAAYEPAMPSSAAGKLK